MLELADERETNLTIQKGREERPRMYADIEKFGISSCTIADVLDGLGTFGALSYEVRSLNAPAPKPVFGQAYTVQWELVRKQCSIVSEMPSTWNQVRDFLVPELRSADGLVYVAGGGPLVKAGALAGGISSMYFDQTLHFEAVILGGAIRDKQIIDQLNLPIWGTNFCPTDTQGAYRVAHSGKFCVIDGFTVRTGDWIFADANGVIVIPNRLVKEVIRQSIEVEKNEASIINKVRAGAYLPGLIDVFGRI